MKNTKEIIFRNKFISILFVVLVIWAIFLTLQLSALEKKVISKEKWHKIIYHSAPLVDTSVETLQNLDGHFKVGKINVTQHLDGVKIKGIIINTSSVGHRNSEFKIELGGQERSFYVDYIGAGSQGVFNVFIPAVSPADARYATIEYQQSTVVWRK